MKKILKYLSLFFLLLLIVIVATSYHSGQDVETLKAKYVYPESAFVEIEGMNVHYRKTGSGPPIVLIHGVASSLHTWEVWQEKLSQQYTVITFDVPSFGLTGPHPKGDYSLDMYMGFLDEFMNEMGIDSCYLGGNSFGSYLSWNYANHNPSFVKKLILQDGPAASIGQDRTINIGFLLSSHPLTKGITHRITPRFLVEKSVRDMYGDNDKIKDGIYQLYYDMLTRKGNREGFSEVLTVAHQDEKALERVKKINQPTLIQWGELDPLFPPEDAKRLQQHIPHADLKIYKGVGHIPMEEIPEETVQDAMAFLVNRN